jgi:hypothetical protein
MMQSIKVRIVIIENFKEGRKKGRSEERQDTSLNTNTRTQTWRHKAKVKLWMSETSLSLINLFC